MSASSISVIITTFNRAHFVTESLESVLNQTREPDEIIVVNDGSKDNTRSVLAPYGDRITYLEKENGGLASALNVGLKQASKDYVYILDDDDAACPDTLAVHAAALDENPEYGFTYSPCFAGHTGPDGRIVRGDILPQPFVLEEDFLLRLYEGCFLTTPGMLTRRSCYESIGPYDESLTRCEDYDRKIQLARRFRPLYVDRPSFCRRIHDEPRGGGTIANFTMQNFDVIALKYERPIFERFRRDLHLSEYLPCTPSDSRTDELDGDARREALLSRMAVMGLHGAWEAALEDLQMLADDRTKEGRLTERERQFCWLTVSEPASIRLLLEEPALLKSLLTPTKSRLNQDIRSELARGLLYTVMAYSKGVNTGLRVRKIGARERMRLGLLGARLLGGKGAVNEVLRRLGY